MYSYCFFNSEIKKVEQAHVPLNDLSFLRGYGIFDYFRTYHLQPFLLDEYLSRFMHSAEAMDLQIKYSKQELKEIIAKLLSVNEISTDVGIRMILTGGETFDSMTADNPSFFIMVETLQPYLSDNFTNGVKLISQEFLRQFPAVKTTNYINAVRNWKACKAAGAVDILYYFNNNVLETSRSNIFIFKNKKLITPSENILFGCTRNFVLSIAKPFYAIEERNIALNELWEADEIFITGTTKKITPVVNIDDRKIKDGNPGIDTQHLMLEFDKHLQSLK